MKAKMTTSNWCYMYLCKCSMHTTGAAPENPERGGQRNWWCCFTSFWEHLWPNVGFFTGLLKSQVFSQGPKFWNFVQNLGCAKFTGFFTGCFPVTGYFTYFSQHFHRFSSRLNVTKFLKIQEKRGVPPPPLNPPLYYKTYAGRLPLCPTFLGDPFTHGGLSQQTFISIHTSWKV